jgi:hypothetical protein
MSDFWDRFKNVVRSEWNSVFSDEADGGDPIDPESMREAHRAAQGQAPGPSASLGRPSVDSAFRLLDLHPRAPMEEVRQAYFGLARHYYPLVTSADAGRASNARSVIFALTEAYEVLCEHLVPLSDEGKTDAAV